MRRSLLAIDAGNSQIELGLDGDCGWRARWQLESKIGRTIDEYGVMVDELFKLDGARRSEVGCVVLSSVVPSLTPVLVGMSRRLFGLEPFVVAPGVRTGIEVRYDPPGSLGSDRLVDALAARARCGAPVVVIDFGTATTFNVVDGSGTFIGGAIAPGLGVAATALAQSGARLSRIDLSPPDGMGVVGRNTAQSMRAGVLFGHAGLVDGLLDRIDRELAPSPRVPAPVIATGGMCRLMAPLVNRINAAVPDLTLDGLRLIHEMNLP